MMGVALVAAAPFPSVAGCYGRDGAAQQTRFRILGGEVQDTISGLVWKRCSLGTEWAGKDSCVGQITHLGLDEAIALASDGWRVPSGPELQSLIDVGCGSPVVDQSVFPDIRADDEGHAKYWTTNAMGALDLYWNFDFIDGQADANSRGIQLAVRFVKSAR